MMFSIKKKGSKNDKWKELKLFWYRRLTTLILKTFYLFHHWNEKKKLNVSLYHSWFFLPMGLEWFQYCNLVFLLDIFLLFFWTFQISRIATERSCAEPQTFAWTPILMHLRYHLLNIAGIWDLVFHGFLFIASFLLNYCHSQDWI